MRRLLPFVLLTGCVTAQPASSALTVADVWARHHALDGKVIRVRGVVAECYSLGCELYQSADDRSKWLGIGTSDTFDAAVQSYLGKQIVVKGLFRADCLHALADPANQTHRADGELTVVICTDRADMIINPQLVGVVR